MRTPPVRRTGPGDRRARRGAVHAAPEAPSWEWWLVSPSQNPPDGSTRCGSRQPAYEMPTAIKATMAGNGHDGNEYPGPAVQSEPGAAGAPRPLLEKILPQLPPERSRRSSPGPVDAAGAAP